MGNKIVFPIPARSYSEITYQNNIVYVPNPYRKSQIPCILITSEGRSSNNLLVFFHGNSEDAGMCFSLGHNIHETFGIDVLLVEYPGYGIYSGEPKEVDIYYDSELILHYFVNIHPSRYRPENILLLGRSMGSSPAIHLAGKHQNLGGLILVCPFTSIEEVAADKAGIILSKFLPSIFDNRLKIKSVATPTLLVHGDRDTVVPVHHSKYLADNLSTPYKMLRICQGVGHNGLHLEKELLIGLSEFLETFAPQFTSTSKMTSQSRQMSKPFYSPKQPRNFSGGWPMSPVPQGQMQRAQKQSLPSYTSQKSHSSTRHLLASTYFHDQHVMKPTQQQQYQTRLEHYRYH
eukprot:TRINITY_DN576_c0_g1_i1.p1 TRINITY_DN576_c0_g1~~TRINITY_DN576_c0_g1_i1.p1  ORF type:complete len:346 (-),score=14.84 TRINITY_DN576_c0_g1_i1:111-1148(-)